MLTKVCTKCGLEKTVDCFSKEKNGKYSVNSVCKSCVAVKDKLRYQANPKKATEQKRLWRKSNPEKSNNYLKLWKQANREKVNATKAHHRASKLRATPSWADKEAITGMYELAIIFNSTRVNLQVDHIVPLNSDKVCGLHCEANLQLLPASSNISKGNRWWPDMW